MKVSGFTFIRNAIKYDYPIVEAIKSILPICDEVIVAVGKSDDATLSLFQNIVPEIEKSPITDRNSLYILAIHCVNPLFKIFSMGRSPIPPNSQSLRQRTENPSCLK